MLTIDDRPDGEPVLAIDNLGAGTGAVVVVTTDGLMVRDMVGAKTSPTRYAVMGLADDR
jgi:microcompartment protein CcmK/EutM